MSTFNDLENFIALLFFLLELYPYLQEYVVAEHFHITEYNFSLFFQTK